MKLKGKRNSKATPKSEETLLIRNILMRKGASIYTTAVNFVGFTYSI